MNNVMERRMESTNAIQVELEVMSWKDLRFVADSAAIFSNDKYEYGGYRLNQIEL